MTLFAYKGRCPRCGHDHSDQLRTSMMTKASRDVLAERRRQIQSEGWTPEHDDQHAHGEMALAASCYAEQGPSPYGVSYPTIPARWPWDGDWWKPKDYRSNLVRAAALLLAEIERLDRAEQASRHAAAAPWLE